MVLFSSKSPARVLQNIRSVTDAPVSAKQIDLFTQVVEEAIVSGRFAQ